MPFIDSVLEPPSYGWKDEDGNLSKPNPARIFREFFSRLNIFKNKKNWLSFTSWMMVAALGVFLCFFIFKYFSLTLLLVAFVYSMVIMGSHGTVWYHRYCTHRAFKFRNHIWRFITQNITLKIIPEEIYVISHHVHHAKSDEPGDPYNATGGFLYCFLADVNHQPINRNMDLQSYSRCVQLMKHTGQVSNTYAQYQRWGSLTNPVRTIAGVLLNWSFWFVVFYLIGGPGLACALFGAAGVWAWVCALLIMKAMARAKTSGRMEQIITVRICQLTSSGPAMLPANGTITITCTRKVPAPVFYATRLILPGTISNF